MTNNLKKFYLTILLIFVLYITITPIALATETNETLTEGTTEEITEEITEASEYTINYVLNKGTNNKENPTSYTPGTAITLKNPTRTGYTFAGWYSDSTYKNKITTISEKSSGEITIYAKWTANTYTIKFNGNGATSGKISNQSNRKYDTNYKLPANTFKKKGYTFTGWNTKKDGSGKTYKNKESIKNLTSKDKATVTLYAQWQKTKYTITYKLNGGKNNKNNPSNYYITTSNITLKNPTRTGYTFAGWYSDSKYKTKVTTIKKGSTGNKTLYAKWTANTYTIKFNGNGSTSGKMSNQNNIKYNTSYKLTANAFKKKGYTFTGWNTKKDGSGKTYKNKESIKNLTSKNKATVTLYAQWKKVKYTITYKLNGGKNNKNNPSNYYVTTSNITLKNPTRTGYTFVGWYSDSKYKNKVTTIKKGSTGNKTLYAKWKAKVLTTTANTSITLKDEIRVPIKFTKTDYYVYYKVDNTDIVTCSWDREWNNNVIDLIISAEQPGTTYVTVTNNYNKESIKFKVTVPTYWENVKVIIPDTIGESDNPENRMQILDYQFYTGYSNYYYMNVKFKLVEYGKPRKSSWSEYFYCYDENGNILDKCYMYAGSLYLGNIYYDDMLIPKGTAKIEFIEYPYNNPDVPTKPDENDNGNSNTKWSYSDAQTLGEYTKSAYDFSKKAYEDAKKAQDNGNTSLKSTYLNLAIQNMKVAVSSLKQAESLAKNRAELPLTDGGTLLTEIQSVISIYDGIDNYTIDSSNASSYEEEIYNMASDGSMDCSLLNILSSKLKLEFFK